MSKFPLSILSLLVGLALGFLVHRQMNEAEIRTLDDEVGQFPSKEELVPSKTSRDSPDGKSKNLAAGTAFSPRLQELRNLVSTSHVITPGLEFLIAISELGVEEFPGLIAELEDYQATDARDYKLRNAMFRQWAVLDSQGAWKGALSLGKDSLRRAALGSVITEVAQSDAGEAEGMIRQLDDEQDRMAALNLFVQAVAPMDPETGFRVYLELHNGNSNSYPLNALFSSWAGIDAAAAIASLDQIENARGRAQARHAIAAHLATIDPARAIAFAQDTDNYNERRDALEQVFQRVAANDPLEALSMLEGVPNDLGRERVLSLISLQWFQQDSDAALAWVKSLPAMDQVHALDRGMWYIIRSDPVLATELVEGLPLSRGSRNIHANLASSWARHDPEAAAEWARNLPSGRARADALRNIYGELSKTDPQKAAEIFQQEGYRRQNSHQAGEILANWASKDFDAAMTWLDELAVGGEARTSIISSTVSRWADLDLHQARDFALGLEKDKEREVAITNLMNRWVDQNADEAKSWALSNLDGEIRNKALSSVIQELASKDATAAVALYEEVTANLSEEAIGEQFKDASRNLVRRWSYQDPAGAGQWLLQQPANENRERLVGDIVGNWVEYDLEGAANFVLELDQGSERDRAVESLLREVNVSDPEAAFLWANSIGDEQKRERQIKITVKEWRERDAEAARAAVDAAEISPEAKARMVEEFE